MDDVLRRGLRTGALMAGAVTTTMMIASAVERGSPWAGFNAMASAVSGPRARDGFDRVETPLGIGLLSSGLVLWGIGFDGLRSLGRSSEPLVSGLLAAVGGLVFDRIVLPRWLLPNFRRKLGLLGTIAKYVTLGVTAAVSAATESASTRAQPNLGPHNDDEYANFPGHRTTLPFGFRTPIGRA